MKIDASSIKKITEQFGIVSGAHTDKHRSIPMKENGTKIAVAVNLRTVFG